MERTTKTIQGDTWDILALDLYGTEKLAWVIQAANPDYLDLLFFPQGVVLVIPDTPKKATAAPVAPWRRGLLVSKGEA